MKREEVDRLQLEHLKAAAKKWTLTDLWFLRVKLKPEYNADNLEIYRREAVILKGDGKHVVHERPVGRA